MTLPSWTFSEAMTQVVAFLNQDVVKGLVMAILGLALATRIIDFVKSISKGM